MHILYSIDKSYFQVSRNLGPEFVFFIAARVVLKIGVQWFSFLCLEAWSARSFSCVILGQVARPVQ